MLCPRCQQTVSPAAIAPGVQQCTCGAFICDANVRRGIVAKDGVGDVLWQQHLLAAPPSSVPCPSCTTPLRVVNYRGVEVDGCPSCGVLLLDPGELTALTGHTEPPPPLPPSSLSSPALPLSPFLPPPVSALPSLELAREPRSRRASSNVSSSSSGGEVAYEMWWDCSACGTAALLGKSQRCCPNCGSPQDPTKRYFPPPGQEVVADGHQYQGADWSCAACQTPNGAAAAFCVNCGNPKDGNATVTRVKDQLVKGGRVIDEVALQAKSLQRGFRRRKPMVIAAAVAIVVVVLALLFIKHDVAVGVTARTWTRAIDIERFRAQQDSAWCDQMPHDAYSASRSREVRSHKSIPDGQECHTRRVDRGDGTFTTKNECTTKYRKEPVYSDKCRYTVDRWGVDRTAGNSGTGISPRPTWPAVHLNGQRSGRGAEREGSRRARNIVHLQSVTKAKDTWTCDFDESRWVQLTEGTRLNVKVNMLGMISCDTLGAPR